MKQLYSLMIESGQNYRVYHMNEGQIICNKTPPIAYIEINRPEKRNAMTMEMWDLLGKCSESFCNDEKVKVVVYRGRGGSFSAGDDIYEMFSIDDTQDADRFFNTLSKAFRALASCSKPTIAVIEGPAVGGGGEILLAMDYVISSRDSIIGFPEIHLGLIPPILSTLGVSVLGMRKARLLALSGALFTPDKAKEYGIVDVVADDVDKELKKAVDFFLSLPGDAVTIVKRLTFSVNEQLLVAALESLKKLSLSEESKRRMKAFIDKRLTRPALDL